MKRGLGFAALGLAAYAVFAVATVPATFIAERVAHATKGTVLLAGARGNLWQGEAQARVLPLRGAPTTIDTVRWTFRPLRLFAGRVAFDVKLAAAGLAGSLEAARTPGGWEARDVAMRGDASGLAALVPILGAVRPEGAMSIAAPRLAWDGEALAGEATAEWRGASVGWSEVKPVGSYRASLRGTKGPAQISITTLDGPLRVTGQGTFAPPSALAFTGEARADAAQARALEPLLAMMGARRPDGAHGFEWRP